MNVEDLQPAKKITKRINLERPRTMEEVEENLKKYLTEDFLSTLIESMKVVGWQVDLIEVDKLARELFYLANKEYTYQGETYELPETRERFLPKKKV